MPGGLGAPPPPPPSGAPLLSRLARHAYSKKAAVSVYAQLKKAHALGLPRGVDRSDPGLFAEPGQVGVLGLPDVCAPAGAAVHACSGPCSCRGRRSHEHAVRRVAPSPACSGLPGCTLARQGHVKRP